MTYAKQLKLMCYKFFVSGPRLNCIPVLVRRHRERINLWQICSLLIRDTHSFALSVTFGCARYRTALLVYGGGGFETR